MNAGKVAFKKTAVSYLGHILSPEGVNADPAKVEAIVNMKKPTDMNGVRRIMGSVKYLAKFLPGLSDVSEPLGSTPCKPPGCYIDIMKSRGLVFLPNMSVELKDHISTCNTCCALGPKQPKETLVCHDVPDRPWAKIATDLFEFDNKGYL